MNHQKPLIAFTGAAGRVGRNVIPFLREKWNVRGLDIHADPNEENPIQKVDLLDLEATLAAFDGVASVVHSAIASYRMGTGDNHDHPAVKDYHTVMLDVNIKGTYNVYEAARILKIPQVVFISSLTAVTGYLPGDSHLEETLPPCPRNVYACTKLFGENLGQTFHRSYGIRSISLRLGQPYPLGYPQEKIWEQNPYDRAFFVTHQDTAHAIDCALRATHIPIGVYNIVSNHAFNVVSHDAAKEIGYTPK